MLQLIPPTDPLLIHKVNLIPPEELSSPPIQKAIQDFTDFAYDLQKTVGLCGLAAPQVGLNLAMILVDTALDPQKRVFGKLELFINPEIIAYSSTSELMREGCFSTDRICGIVPRAHKICIRALDAQGECFEKEYEGFTARIFQHEIDHLKGIRFPDRVGPHGTLHWVTEEELPLYRQNWQNWDKKVPFEKWLEIRGS